MKAAGGGQGGKTLFQLANALSAVARGKASARERERELMYIPASKVCISH